MKPIGTLFVVASLLVSACSKKESPTTPTPTACAYSLSSTSQAPAASGGSFSVTLTKTSGASCTWAATSNASWVTFSGSSSGTDSATLTMAVAPNTSTSARGGTVTVSWNGGNAQIAVNQSGLSFGQCVYSFASPTQTVPAEGGISSAALTVTGSGCSWTAASNASWLTITPPVSGTATALIAFSTTPNPDSTVRAGTITVTSSAGTTTQVTITQSGVTSCVYTLAPASQSVTAAGGSFSFVPTRNTPNGCAWSASTTTPWITLTGPTSGLSGATVTYSVAPNAGAARTGAVQMIWSGGNTDFVVTQAAAAALAR